MGYQTYLPLLPKSLLVGPCYVTSNQSVEDSALIEAGRTLTRMLSKRSDVALNLRIHGAITAVFGRHETVYNPPYFQDLREKPQADGGLGGTVALPVTAVSERNLLKLPKDPYLRGTNEYSANVSVHEFAHTIMNIGLNQTEIAAIRFRWRAAVNDGLWKGDWASTNHMEFFAELSQIYFYSQCALRTDFHLGINGPEELQRYDSMSYELIHSIYHGSTHLE